MNEKYAKCFPLQEILLKKKKTYIIALRVTSILYLQIPEFCHISLILQRERFGTEVNRFAQGHETERAWDLNADFLTASSVSCL